MLLLPEWGMSNTVAKNKQASKNKQKRENREKTILSTPCYAATSTGQKFVPVLFNIKFLGTINVCFIYPSCTRAEAELHLECSNKKRSFPGSRLWDVPLFPSWALPIKSACQVFVAALWIFIDPRWQLADFLKATDTYGIEDATGRSWAQRAATFDNRHPSLLFILAVTPGGFLWHTVLSHLL